jgi:hypothetical protein
MYIAYNGIEPVVQASVYSLAYLIDGQPELIGPTLVAGFQTGFNNFVQGEISWFASFLPPRPPIPFPPFPKATVTARAAAGTPRVAAATVAVHESPIVAGTPAGTDAPPAVELPANEPAGQTPSIEPAVRRGPQRIAGDDTAGPDTLWPGRRQGTANGHRGAAHESSTGATSADAGTNTSRAAAR